MEKKIRCPTLRPLITFFYFVVYYQNALHVKFVKLTVFWFTFQRKQRAILILLQDMSMSNPSLNHTEKGQKNEMSKNVIQKERKERNMSRQRKNDLKEEEG